MPEENEIIEPTVEDVAESAETEESDTSQPETLEETQEEVKEEKKASGVQKRIDELVKQREEWKRQAQELTQIYSRQSHITPEPETKRSVSYPDLPKPTSDQFETWEEFVVGIADWRDAVRERQIQEQQLARKIKDWKQQARRKYSDWDERFTNDLGISPEMAEVLLESDKGVDIGYYLATNPDESDRIASLPPARQTYELGKLESKLSAPPQKSKTNAPSPTAQLGGRDTPAKNPETMSYEEYKAWRASGGGR